jgi:hypothetical protein
MFTYTDPYFHPILTSTISENSFSTKRRSMQITGYNVVVQIGSVVSSQIYRKDGKLRCATQLNMVDVS